MSRLFAITLFVSAFLLFWVQPLVAKLLLPYLGGSPTVWNVAMCFFQAMLLAGYAWAHWLAKRSSLRLQTVVQVSTLALAALLLPFHLPPESARSLADGANPFLWLLSNLALTCGLPFFLLSANSPLLQRWFAKSGDDRAADPYFLFAASNAGSFLALIAFPLVFEPALRLAGQASGWMFAYLLLAGLVGWCGFSVWRRGDQRPAIASAPTFDFAPGAEVVPITRSRRLRWVWLAFIPSSLMLGVTQYLTTDVATLPLLWVLPLSIYLLTFVLAFGPRSFANSIWLARFLPILTIAVLFTIISGVNDPIWILFPLHLLLLLLCGLVCHGRLAADRPPVESLTEFYFWLSLGGVAGGVFNGLIAPVVFDRVAEYPLLLVGMALLAQHRVSAGETPFRRRAAWMAAVGIGALTFALMTTGKSMGAEHIHLVNLVAFGVPCILVFFLVDHPRRFAVAMASIMAASWMGDTLHGRTLLRERNFFGVSRVEIDPQGAFRQLFHGSTIHGRQFIDPRHQSMPLSYYHPTGPLKQIFQEFETRKTSKQVAVIGLGAGAMAAYARPDQEWTYYEIDPLVIRIAQNTNLFTYLSNSKAARLKIVQGDARLRLHEAPDGRYGLIVLDAFSSDSVPVHLLTREAIQLYLSKLAPDGLLAFHVSNRNLDVKAVVRTLALDAGLICIERDEQSLGTVEMRFGKDPAQWAMAAREAGGMRTMVRPEFWHEEHAVPGLVWTDDYSSVWRVIKR